MKSDFASSMAEIKDLLSRMSERGEKWLKENIRLGNIAEQARMSESHDMLGRLNVAADALREEVGALRV